jgi:Carboxypeptidase regulatory-like domain
MILVIGIRIIVTMCVALLPAIGSAQSGAAGLSHPIRVTGRVVDPTNMPLRRATVSLTAVGSQTDKSTVLADEDGVFAFNSVSPGAYVLRFDAPGFLSRRVTVSKAVTEHDVNVGSILLQIGEITEGPVVPVGRPNKEKPITVCESLADSKKFSGEPIAIVGRIECGASLIDRVCFLTEGRCKQPVKTDGYAWPNKVLIVNYWEEGMPKPPSTVPEIDHATLLKKLSLVGKSTTLGLHKEPQFKTEGQTITFSHLADVKDEWGIAYGLFFTAPKLRKDSCGDEIGCGGFDGAPVALIALPNALRPLDGYKNSLPKR